MDKIKTVKIKNPDGSVSEETYTISVDAKDVDMKNGKDLQDTIGNINVDRDGSIAEQLGKYKDYDSDIETLYADIDSLEAKDTDLENDIIDLQVNKINKTDIIDNLNSSSNTKVLSAKQGKVLGDAVAALDTDIKKKAYFFDTVAAMKVANLKDGDYVCTLGYYSANDGGGTTYKIRTITNQDVVDNQTIITLNNNTLVAELIIDNELNVLSIGFKNDGITDNSNLLTDKIKSYNLYFPDGVYIFTETLTFTNHCHINLNNAEIKLNNVNTNFIYVKYDSTEDRTNYIKGGIINGNFKCNNLITVDGIYSMEIYPRVMKNFNNYGYLGKYDNTIRNSSNTKLHSVYILNENPTNNTTALYDNTYDNTFYDIVIKDIERAVVTNSSSFLNIHHWLSYKELIPNSRFATITGRTARFTNCTIDTIKNGFNSTWYGYATITNLQIIFNTNIYDSSYQLSDVPTLFDNGNNSVYNVDGLTIGKLAFDINFANNDTFSRETQMNNIVIHKESGNETISHEYNKENNYFTLLTGSTDYDSITKTGYYTLNTYNGSNGNNVPNNAVGIMQVINCYGIPNADQVIMQMIYGGAKILLRRYTLSNDTWTDWYTLS